MVWVSTAILFSLYNRGEHYNAHRVNTPISQDRYQRQLLLPQIGPAGQNRLAGAHVLLLGCGALGCSIAPWLVRSGVGYVRLIDRDLVDLTNLHRQTLFTEADASARLPKAIAAANSLQAANSQVKIEPLVADVHSGNIQTLVGVSGSNSSSRPHLILDGTDNAQTRYLLNDLSVKYSIPWIYGACVGVEGRAMFLNPIQTPCLRCLYPTPPSPGELATCDTAGVLPTAAGLIGALQASLAIRFLIQRDASPILMAMDLWSMRFQSLDISQARHADCPCCGRHQYEFLDRPADSSATSLCGRNAVQVRPDGSHQIDLAQLATRLASSGTLKLLPFMLRCQLPEGITLSIFPDGRVIVDGTGDVSLARTLVARYVGL